MRRAAEAAEADAEEAMELADKRRSNVSEQRVDPDSLTGRHKRRKNKEERLEVCAGREQGGGDGAGGRIGGGDGCGVWE